MRFAHRLKMFCSALLVGVVPAALSAQGSMKIGITTSSGQTVWYTDPIWIWIGGGALLLIIVLAVMAARKRNTKSTTTVIR